MSSLLFIVPPTGGSGSPDLYESPRENASTKNPTYRIKDETGKIEAQRGSQGSSVSSTSSRKDQAKE
jgi:hypothetical protein